MIEMEDLQLTITKLMSHFQKPKELQMEELLFKIKLTKLKSEKSNNLKNTITLLLIKVSSSITKLSSKVKSQPMLTQIMLFLMATTQVNLKVLSWQEWPTNSMMLSEAISKIGWPLSRIKETSQYLSQPKTLILCILWMIRVTTWSHQQLLPNSE